MRQAAAPGYGSENSWIVLDAAIDGFVKRVLAPANSM
jgi:hypothetical protein